MSLIKAIENRRAYRALSEKPIPREVLLHLVDAAHLAPSSGNNQPWRIITVVDEPYLSRLKESLSGGNYWALKAPAITAFITDPAWSLRLKEREYALFELGMAAMNYQLQGVEEGLYVHPIAGFSSTKAKAALGMAEEALLLTLIILGYPGDSSDLSDKHKAQERAPQVRKPLDQISAFNQWRGELNPLTES
ncbi:MAG: nitroreductase family protein [Sphaerochaetaceae bacterium]